MPKKEAVRPDLGQLIPLSFLRGSMLRSGRISERSGYRASLVAANDYSASFAEIREHLANSHGVRLVDYVGQLTPIYWRVYFDLAVGCAALAGSIVLIAAGQTAGIPPVLLVPLGAALIGFWYFYLVSFIHEGVHSNLAHDRNINDLICGVLTSCMIGAHIGSWRKHHFEHHRSLGTIHDTEMSYFFPLNCVAVLKSVLGVRAIEALLSYMRRTSGRGRNVRRHAVFSGIEARLRVGLIVGLTAHGVIVGGLWALGWAAASVAWVLGIGGVMPLLNTIRQVVEHRADSARPDVDYSQTDQGACARMFGNGWLDSVFGSAGANRHLLHHWEPQVSYTRLADLERFLADTPVRTIMDRRRTTYYRAFRDLFSA